VIHLTLLDLMAIAAALADEDSAEPVPLDWDAMADAVAAATGRDDPIESAAVLFQGLLPDRALALLVATQLLELNGIEAKFGPEEETRKQIASLGNSIEQTEAWLTRRTTGRQRLPAWQEDGALQRYLTAVATNALLTVDQEAALAHRVQAGRRARADVPAGQPLTPETEAIIRDGFAAERELNQAHLGTVVSVAKRYRRTDTPLMHTIFEGNDGLSQAVQQFDPDSGRRFSTYAEWWIRRAITTAQSAAGED
jgi:DNA-directed RNA polymerase sigma subunit (sigma70/sigma32)